MASGFDHSSHCLKAGQGFTLQEISRLPKATQPRSGGPTRAFSPTIAGVSRHGLESSLHLVYHQAPAQGQGTHNEGRGGREIVWTLGQKGKGERLNFTWERSRTSRDLAELAGRGRGWTTVKRDPSRH